MRCIISTFRVLQKSAALRLPKRFSSSEVHEFKDPGPPTTYDAIPIPFKPYKTVYRQLQTKFNRYLIFSVLFYAFSLALAFYDDVFMLESIRTPLSYRNRNKSN